jgi:hypothetical protein
MRLKFALTVTVMGALESAAEMSGRALADEFSATIEFWIVTVDIPPAPVVIDANAMPPPPDPAAVLVEADELPVIVLSCTSRVPLKVRSTIPPPPAAPVVAFVAALLWIVLLRTTSPPGATFPKK